MFMVLASVASGILDYLTETRDLEVKRRRGAANWIEFFLNIHKLYILRLISV
jgi:hypothetical protein